MDGQEKEKIKMNNRPHIVFVCFHCQDHFIYVNKTALESQLPNLMNMNCPCCNAEPDNNWVLYREGDLDEERKNKKKRKTSSSMEEVIKHQLLKTLSLN